MAIKSNGGNGMLPDHHGISSGIVSDGPGRLQSEPMQEPEPGELHRFINEVVRKNLTPALVRALEHPANREMLDFELGRAFTKVSQQGFKLGS